jgi:Fe2+ or Zn2+ uptake regulation protein
MAEDLHAVIAARLADADQRYTAPRRRLVDVLAGADRPLTIAEVLAQSPGLAQSSAYRNLAVLEAAEVVERVAGLDEFSRFELSPRLTTDEHHHHLICVDCGLVTDFTVPAKVERSLAEVMGDVERRNGFVAEHHRLDLVGRCVGCASS